MNQSKKILKSKPAEAKKKRGKWMEKLITFRRKLSEWWGNRSERQKMWMFYFVCAFVITLPYTSFLTRTYLAMWELNRNSNLTYRLGQSLSEEELQEKFELHVPKNAKWNWYSLKEVNGNVEYAEYRRYPSQLLPLGRYRMTDLATTGNGFQVFEVQEGMEMEAVDLCLKGKGYKEIKTRNEGKKYHKGGLVFFVANEGGRVTRVSCYLAKYSEYIYDVRSNRIKGDK